MDRLIEKPALKNAGFLFESGLWKNLTFFCRNVQAIQQKLPDFMINVFGTDVALPGYK